MLGVSDRHVVLMKKRIGKLINQGVNTKVNPDHSAYPVGPSGIEPEITVAIRPLQAKIQQRVARLALAPEIEGKLISTGKSEVNPRCSAFDRWTV
jgi:hypothetical protein